MRGVFEDSNRGLVYYNHQSRKWLLIVIVYAYGVNKAIVVVYIKL